MPTPDPVGQWSELADNGQRAKQELAGPKGDDECRKGDRDRPRSPCAERRSSDLATEAVATRPVSEIIEIVEVRVLAKGQSHTAREHRHLGVVVLGAGPTMDGHHGIGGVEPLMRKAGEIAAQACAASDLKAPDLGVTEESVGLDLASQHP